MCNRSFVLALLVPTITKNDLGWYFLKSDICRVRIFTHNIES